MPKKTPKTDPNPDYQVWQDTSTPFKSQCILGQKLGWAAREVSERRWRLRKLQIQSR